MYASGAVAASNKWFAHGSIAPGFNPRPEYVRRVFHRSHRPIRGALMLQWLEYCVANFQFVGSNLAHTGVVGFVSLRSHPSVKCAKCDQRRS